MGYQFGFQKREDMGVVLMKLNLFHLKEFIIILGSLIYV
jgi:hypothetical protein